MWLEALRDTHWRSTITDGKWQPLVPELFSHNTSGKHATQIIEQFDGSLTHIGLAQAQLFDNIRGGGVAFTVKQMVQQSQLLDVLDHKQLVHGDLKRRNILVLGDVLALGDWSFAGALASKLRPNQIPDPDDYLCPEVGFPDLPLHLVQDKHALPHCIWNYLNRLQLYLDSAHNRSTYLISDDGKSAEKVPECVLRRLFQIPKNVLSNISFRFVRNNILRTCVVFFRNLPEHLWVNRSNWQKCNDA